MTKPKKPQTTQPQRAAPAPAPRHAPDADPIRRASKLKAGGAAAPVADAPAPTSEPVVVPAAPLVRPGGKLGVVVDLLRRPQGARVDELMAATSWQSHTVRGAMSGALKGRLKLAVTSEPTEAGRVYRITGEVSA